MALFRRGRSRKSPEATEAEKRLSMRAWATINERRRDKREWNDLVAVVGPDQAVEHAEVWVLREMVRSVEAVVADRMQSWRLGQDDQDVLRSMLRLAQVFRPKSAMQMEAIQDASTRPESLAVIHAAGFYGLLLFKTNMDRIEGYDNEDTRSAAAGFIVADVNWLKATYAWDAATGRPSLPLVRNAI